MIRLKKLLSILKKHGLLPHLDKIDGLALDKHLRPDVAIVDSGLVNEADMTKIMAEYLEIPLINASSFPNAPIAAGGATSAFLKQARILPLLEDDASLTVAMADPLDEASLRSIKLLVNKTVYVRIAHKQDLDRAFDRLYTKNEKEASTGYFQTGAATNLNEEIGPAGQSFNELLDIAINNSASDLHIETTPSGLRTRYRIDGRLIELGNTPPDYLSEMLISRIKILANLNVAENRRPQDGRASIMVSGRLIDIRVSSMPTINGESIVLRLLDPNNSPKNLEALQLSANSLNAVRSMLKNSNGMILTTGPTGSGKTTTLYAALNELNLAEKKIVTLEDPVEYRLNGINQIPINPGIGLHFSNLLRSVLRQDPDIIMVGEIRDAETARLAIQAALTGHLVLSSLHTNTALGAISRLIDMGIEPFLIANAVKGVIGQRLVRKLCDNCKQNDQLTPIEKNALALNSRIKIARPKGCSICHQTGYKGRLAILETLKMGQELQQHLLKQGNIETYRIQQTGKQVTSTVSLNYLTSLQTSLEEILGDEVSPKQR